MDHTRPLLADGFGDGPHLGQGRRLLNGNGLLSDGCGTRPLLRGLGTRAPRVILASLRASLRASLASLFTTFTFPLRLLASALIVAALAPATFLAAALLLIVSVACAAAAQKGFLKYAWISLHILRFSLGCGGSYNSSLARLLRASRYR